MLHAKITAYKKLLVIELIAERSIEGEVTTTRDRDGLLGQSIHNTAQHLGVSAEALELLKCVQRGGDDIGDVDWFRTSDGKATFGWLGGPYAIYNPASSEGSSSYEVLEHVVIPNDVPEGAMQAIDKNAAV